MHRQSDYSAIINRTRKDRCEKARVLPMFARHSRCRLRHSVAVYIGKATPATHDKLNSDHESQNARRYRRTDGRTDDMMMPIVDHTV